MQLIVCLMFRFCRMWIEIMLWDLYRVLCSGIGLRKVLVLFFGCQILFRYLLMNMIGVLLIRLVVVKLLFRVVLQMNGLKLEFGWCLVWIVWLQLFCLKEKLLISEWIVLFFGLREISVFCVVGICMKCRVLFFWCCMWIWLLVWVMLVGWCGIGFMLLLLRKGCVYFMLFQVMVFFLLLWVIIMILFFFIWVMIVGFRLLMLCCWFRCLSQVLWVWFGRWVFGLWQLWCWLQLMRLLWIDWLVVFCRLLWIVVMILQFLVQVLLLQWLIILVWVIFVMQGVFSLGVCMWQEVLIGFLMVVWQCCWLMKLSLSMCLRIQLCCFVLWVGLISGLQCEGVFGRLVIIVILVRFKFLIGLL